MRRIPLAVSILLLSAALLPARQTLASDDLCGRPKAVPQALYDQLSKDTKLREMRRSDVYVALEDGSNGTLWTFTLPAHPAHPAVICRRVMERRGILEIPTSIVCNGPEAACAKLKSDFDMLNERMLDELHKQKR
jgi:hypothetical protein